MHSGGTPVANAGSGANGGTAALGGGGCRGAGGRWRCNAFRLDEYEVAVDNGANEARGLPGRGVEEDQVVVRIVGTSVPTRVREERHAATSDG